MLRMLPTALLLLLVLTSTIPAQETSHYPAGVEGIRAATVPGPGQYLKWYNIFYESNDLKDPNGNTAPVGFDANVFATAPRFIWITETQIFGADYGFDVLVPLIHSDVEIPGLGLGNSRTAIGDIYIEPILLGWHGDYYDIGAAAGVWAPTGDFKVGSTANAGKDFWTGMFSLGSTLYLDDDKSWSVSALGRYETNSGRSKVAIRPGDDFHIEWGVAKQFDKVFDVGLTGYCHWQVTDDRGAGVTWDRSVHDRFFSVGPEVQYFYEPAGLIFQTRYQFEFGARDRPQGRNLVFSFVKIL
ncbi:MAG: transporter [Planctomycetaceae bacterium]